MKVLFDHNIPRNLVSSLTHHTVGRTAPLGWASLQNGDLIAAAEAAGFEVMISGDKNLEYQQRVQGRKIAIVSLSAINWPVIMPYVAAIVKAVDEATSGTYQRVECGTFRRERKPRRT